MSKIRDLKKIVNYELSNVVDACFVKQMLHKDKSKETEEMIDAVVTKFDQYIERINQKNVEKPKLHFKAIKNDLYKDIEGFINQLQKF